MFMASAVALSAMFVQLKRRKGWGGAFNAVNGALLQCGHNFAKVNGDGGNPHLAIEQRNTSGITLLTAPLFWL